MNVHWLSGVIRQIRLNAYGLSHGDEPILYVRWQKPYARGSRAYCGAYAVMVEMYVSSSNIFNRVILQSGCKYRAISLFHKDLFTKIYTPRSGVQDHVNVGDMIQLKLLPRSFKSKAPVKICIQPLSGDFYPLLSVALEGLLQAFVDDFPTPSPTSRLSGSNKAPYTQFGKFCA